MRFDGFAKKLHVSMAWRAGIAALGWLALISCLHWQLNSERSPRKEILMGYMPVIANLASPLLDYATRDGEGVRFKAIKFASFSEMAAALRNGNIQAAFMIAPLAIVLRQQGEDVKIVYIGNRHESTLVVRKDLRARGFSDLAGKTVAVPLRYSGHHLSLLQLVERDGLGGAIRIVEMNPPDMAAALASGSLDAYCVGEPFAAKTLKNGDARLLHYVEDVWENFICNLCVVRQDLIENDPAAVALLVQGAARSGIWAKRHPREAAQVAAHYWNQPVDLVEYALTTPPDRIVFDRFVPQMKEIQHLSDLMVKFGLADSSDISGLVLDRFAQAANVQDVTDAQSILRPARQ